MNDTPKTTLAGGLNWIHISAQDARALHPYRPGAELRITSSDEEDPREGVHFESSILRPDGSSLIVGDDDPSFIGSARRALCHVIAEAAVEAEGGDELAQTFVQFFELGVERWVEELGRQEAQAEETADEPSDGQTQEDTAPPA